MQPSSGQTQAGIAPGAILGGKYRVARLLGQGGMGTVVLAHHEDLDQRVAIKVLIGELAGNPEVVARFTREARAAAKLQSDHVVRVTDVGKFDGVGPYMVMEYLDGRDLGQVLEQRGPLPTAEAVDFVLEAIDAIAEAHAVGIVHRDIKPANLFLAERADGKRLVKVLDFGISKVDVPGDPTSTPKLTSTRSVMGSPAYMSPEQLRSSRDVDARADVWSLGVVLYELLTGVLPFEGETVGAIFTSVVASDPRPLRATRPDLPAALEGTILRCLRKNAAERYANVADLAQSLAPFGSGRAADEVERAVSLLKLKVTAGDAALRPTVASSASMPAAPVPAVAPETQGSWGREARRPETRGSGGLLIFAGAGLVVLCALVGGGILLAHRTKGGATSAPTAATAQASAAGPTAPTMPPPLESEGLSGVAGAASAPAVPSASAAATTSPTSHNLKPASTAPRPPPPSFLDRQR